MIARSFSKIATVAYAAIICIGLVSCSGAVSRPATTAGQQPSQPPAGEPPAGVQLSLSAATSDSRPSAGAQFTLSATVTNEGERTLPAVTLRYYRSTDATITTADTEVGTGAVAAACRIGQRERFSEPDCTGELPAPTTTARAWRRRPMNLAPRAIARQPCRSTYRQRCQRCRRCRPNRTWWWRILR